MIYITIAIVVIGIFILLFIAGMIKNTAEEDKYAEQNFKKYLSEQRIRDDGKACHGLKSPLSHDKITENINEREE